MNHKVQFYSGSNWVTVAKFTTIEYAEDFVYGQVSESPAEWRIVSKVLERLARSEGAVSRCTRCGRPKLRTEWNVYKMEEGQ